MTIIMLIFTMYNLSFTCYDSHCFHPKALCHEVLDGSFLPKSIGKDVFHSQLLFHYQ